MSYQLLKFSPSNAKLQRLAGKSGKKVFSLDILAGKTCVAANECLSYVVKDDEGKSHIKDGPNIKFRCYAASSEALYKNVYELHAYNTNLIQANFKSYLYIRDLILLSIPKNAGIIRLHSSGDFPNITYFKGCIEAAKARPDITWYCYTKCVHLIKQWLEQEKIKHKKGRPSLFKNIDLSQGQLLPNFFVTASYGGKYDDLIPQLNVRSTRVVFSEEEAKQLGLPIDKTDELAASKGGSFNLILHNSQPANTLASKSWSVIKRTIGGYSRSQK